MCEHGRWVIVFSVLLPSFMLKNVILTLLLLCSSLCDTPIRQRRMLLDTNATCEEKLGWSTFFLRKWKWYSCNTLWPGDLWQNSTGVCTSFVSDYKFIILHKLFVQLSSAITRIRYELYCTWLANKTHCTWEVNWNWKLCHNLQKLKHQYIKLLCECLMHRNSN